MELLEKLLDPEFVKKINDNVVFEKDGSISSRALQDFTDEEKELLEENFLALSVHRVSANYNGFNINRIKDLDDREQKSIFDMVLYSDVGNKKLVLSNYDDTRFGDYKIILKVTVTRFVEPYSMNSIIQNKLTIEPIKITAENYCLPLKELVGDVKMLSNFGDDNIFNSFIVALSLDGIEGPADLEDWIKTLELTGSPLEKRFVDLIKRFVWTLFPSR